MNIKNIPISESLLKTWDEIFLTSFDLLYFEDIETATNLLSNDVLIYTRDELKADNHFNNLDIKTTFLMWNVKETAKYVLIVPNDIFVEIDLDKKHEIFLKQWELGRGQIYELSVFEDLIECLSLDEKIKVNELINKNTFITPSGKMVALQKNIWDKFPWDVREKFLIMLAEEYADQSIWNNIDLDIRNKVEISNPYIISKFEHFPSNNGPNCFAAALAAAANSKNTTELIIEKWLNPKSFLLGLEVRKYKVFARYNKFIKTEEIQMTDVILWRDQFGNYVHAAYSLGYGLIFNKHGQVMFNPWQVLKLNDILNNWNYVIENGGEIIIYRKGI